ncbi:ABC transporter ATP-binding protein [Paraburkholderia lycopersici]|uniref:NitT/TauT family transport system ATP-binding protein n=1 Tax=Paraburkholderia lycopersici TaxID=416944 RepID=A0A1G6SFW1_9BURK|nr:nitrate/sulfonate/bicarbonate ABC transporter ATP-binding protein [Paraburkholderia lycopersici]SDD15541.1 NitT/TauT family transport system ATP-binding protein [Paraburkholderia lycopersici]
MPGFARPATTRDDTPHAGPAAPVLELDHVGMSFARPSGDPLPVLVDIDVTLREGEILGLLGRSGSGKSTLLRVAAGLALPSAGRALYRGAPLGGPAEGIAVVFQTFALYPWLTVLANVELGLDASGLGADAVRERAMSAIEMIGLDGFESAFPRELSGGMRQRVGFARALVSEPKLLLMDEPFSALDVLTAETLRSDFLDLWTQRQTPIEAVLMVTHNIEEAVLMCDRVHVLGGHPGHIVATLNVPLPRPRNRLDPAFRAIVDKLYGILTARIAEFPDGSGTVRGAFGLRLPHVLSHRLVGFIDALAAATHDGHAELAAMAAALMLKPDELFPVAAALHLLGFAELVDRTIKLTAAGRLFVRAGDSERKRLFREHVVQFVPLVAHIREVLDEREEHRAPRARFELELEDHLHRADAETTLRTAIDWGRYAGLFSYDDHTRTFGD